MQRRHRKWITVLVGMGVVLWGVRVFGAGAGQWYYAPMPGAESETFLGYYTAVDSESEALTSSESLNQVDVVWLADPSEGELWWNSTTFGDWFSEYYSGVSWNASVKVGGSNFYQGGLSTQPEAREWADSQYPSGGWVSGLSAPAPLPPPSGGMTNSGSGILGDAEPAIATSINVWITIAVLFMICAAAMAMTQKHVPKRKKVWR